MLYLKIDPDNIDSNKVKTAAQIIKNGGLVVFPTETVYGLGANALDPDAVKRIFEAKGRPPDNPLIVHVSNVNMLEEAVDLSRLTPEQIEWVNRLTDRFWPGPLTLVLPKNSKVPEVVTAGLDTVAVRMPNHPVALALIEEAGVPIAAPSANRSGRPSPTRPEDVDVDVDCIIDGGPTEIGLESTVLLLDTEPVILRPGKVTPEELSEVLGKRVGLSGGGAGRPRSPGMKYRHYSPEAEVILVHPGDKDRILNVCEKVRDKRVVVMCTSEETYNKVCHEIESMDAEVVLLGKTLDEVAHNLFNRLRWADREGFDVVIVEGVEEEGIGIAIMNRLKKAAGVG